jgi:hypothetical protein
MLKRANIQWTGKTISSLISKGNINFDNTVQRGLVWDNKRKSLLIHSMIVGYPIPAFYASRNGSEYDMLDGKQRSNAIKDFLNDQFSLTNLPEVDTESGLVDISGSKFSELSEEIQDNIKDYSLTVYYFEGITDDEIAEMFYRLNNGKALSSFDLMRAKIKDYAQIKKLSSHDIFNNMLTAKALSNNKADDLTMQSWAIVNMTDPSFERKYLEPIVTKADITDEQVSDILSAFTKIQEIVIKLKEEESKESARLIKRILTKTNFVSLIPVTIKSIEDNLSNDEFSSWLEVFFGSTRTTSIDESYNKGAREGTAKGDSISRRLTAIETNYNSYFQK